MRNWFGRRKSKGGEGDEEENANDESGKRDSLDPKYLKETSLGLFKRNSTRLSTGSPPCLEVEQGPKDKELSDKAEEVTLLSMKLDREIKRMLYIVKEGENSNQFSWMCKTVPLLVLLMGQGKDEEYSGERERERVETVVCSSNPWP